MKKINNLVLSEKTKDIILYLFLYFIIFIRVFLETAVFSQRQFFFYFVVIHHFCWYLALFYYYAFFARYLLKIKRENISFLALLSPVIFIPLIYSYFSNTQLNLQYLQGDLSDVLFHMITFYKFHQNNSHFFIEMLILFIVFSVGSWIISKSVSRSLLNVLFGFYGSMIFAGLHLFGVYPATKAYFKINTAFKNHQLLTLIYFLIFLIVFFLYSFPEIKQNIKKNKIKYSIAVFSGVVISLTISFLLLGRVYETELTFVDVILLIFPFVTLSVSLTNLWKENSKELINGRFFPIFFGTISLLIIFGISFNIYHM